MNIWDILGIAAIVCLIISFKIGRNAIWGAFTLAIIVGLVISIFRGFEWSFYKKVLIIGVLTGALFELLYRLFRKQIYFYKQKKIIDKKIREEIEERWNTPQ